MACVRRCVRERNDVDEEAGKEQNGSRSYDVWLIASALILSPNLVLLAADVEGV